MTTTLDANPAAAALEQETTSDILSRLNRTPDEVRRGVDPADASGGQANFSPIPAAAMRGDTIPATLGTLTLTLTPLTRKVVREKFVPLVNQWPQVLQFASAVRSPTCPGIDYEGTAALLTAYQSMTYVQTEAEQKSAAAKSGAVYTPALPPSPVTALDVADEVGGLNDALDLYLNVICDTVWLLAYQTPGVAWPRPLPELPEGATELAEAFTEPAPPEGCVWLDDYLDEHLRLADFAELLRLLKAANGSFRGCLSERFTAPSPE